MAAASSVTQSDQNRKVITSFGETDTKSHNNLMALTGEGHIKGIMYAQGTLDAGSLVDAAGETETITVNGAALGDIVMASLDVDIQDMTVTAYVQAANAVEVRIQNESGTTHDLASATLRVIVFDVT